MDLDGLWQDESHQVKMSFSEQVTKLKKEGSEGRGKHKHRMGNLTKRERKSQGRIVPTNKYKREREHGNMETY